MSRKTDISYIIIQFKHYIDKMKIFNIVINEDDNTGMDTISLVSQPAVGVNFLKFEEQKEIKKLSFDADKHIITGVVALAGIPIYRYNKEIGDYYVVFTSEVIEKMMIKYSKMNLNNSVDLQHNGKKVDGVIMFESYIYNKERNIAPVEFGDIPDGSWIASFKVENEELWNEIKSGNELNGFSLAGLFAFAEPENEEVDELEQYIDEILK